YNGCSQMQSLTLLSVSFALLALVDISTACFASGVCGGGCAPPPPSPVCSSGCGAGYGCGHYGCARARAASSRTLKVEKSDSSVEIEEQPEPATPDEKFHACCADRNLPDSCLAKCSYSTYTRDALQSMYFRMDSCPMQAAADIHFCAAQGKDHTSCCARNGVATTLAGEKCMTFCDQRPGNVTQLDLTYLACYDRFENMKACFWHDVAQQN
ncbi:hypothetical protein PFISCL1PPCAC_28282, partial [Pristionchus fissidentatus]